MRWFCVHPALPDNATLRVRSYPSSDAPELGRRVPKGRAVAVVAPEFEVVGASESEVYRWVHVVVPDPDTGEELDGFMMTSLPGGTDLLTTWHKAGFHGCCRVENPKAFLFDGPTAAADVVGLVDSVDLPYGILEVEGSRALIQHAEHEQAWIDTKELDPVCLPLRHSGCSVAHSFYTLNETLPPEAQIAIRTFPSKKADTVGLLSRGDILEVSFKSGPWLQIATAGGGEAFWIMWTTDTFELLVEVSDHGSPRCMPASDEAVLNEPSEPNATKDIDMELGQEHMAEDGVDDTAEVLANIKGADRDIAHEGKSAEDFSHESAMEVSVAGVQVGEKQTADEGSAIGPVSFDTSARFGESAAPEEVDTTDVETPNGDDHDQPRLDDAVNGETGGAVHAEASWEDRPINPARQQQFSWDDRPIRPTRADEDLGVHASIVDDDSADAPPSGYSDERPITPLQEHAAWNGQHSETATADEDATMGDDATEAIVSTPNNDVLRGGDHDAIDHPDDRPIRPARGGHAWDERPIRPAPTVNEQGADVSSDGSIEVTSGVTVDPDDRPIRPSVVDDDTEMDVANSGDADDGVDINESGEPREGEQQVRRSIDDRPIQPSQQQQAWDELPIQPAQIAGDQDAGTTSDAVVESSDEVPIDPTELEISTDDRPIRPAQQQQAWNELPIQPAQPADDKNTSTTHDAMVEDSVEVTIDPVERPIGSALVEDDTVKDTAEIDNDASNDDPTHDEKDQAALHPDERPIKPAQQLYAWDGRPIRPATINDSIEGGRTLAQDSDTSDVVGEQESCHPDERPIRPAQQHNAWDEQPIQPALTDEMVETDEVTVEQAGANISSVGAQQSEEQSSPHWDERSIKPTQQPFAWDERPIRPTVSDYTLDESGGHPEEFDTTSPSEATQDVSKQDERLSDPAHAEEVTEMEIADDDDGPEEMDTADNEGAVEVSGDGNHGGVEQANSHWDDRPIRPAQTQHPWDDRPIKPAPQDQAWDEGPIRPTDEDVEMEAHDANETDTTQVASDEVDQDDAEQALSSHWDDRPIKPAQQHQAWDDRPIRPASSAENAFGSVGLEVADEQTPATKVDDEMADAAEQSPALDDDVARAVASKEADDDYDMTSEDANGGLTNPRSESASEPRYPRSPDSEPTPELEADGYSFLTQFGVAAYYNWKKRSMTSSDELSQIQYDAMVEGDVDVLLETLAADVDLVDDWLQYVPVDPASVADLHGDSSRLIDALYDRDSAPSEPPRPVQNSHAAKPPIPPLSPAAARKARLKALFRRLPGSSDSTSVFDIIMGGGSGDSILEAEVADDESNFALTSQFRYPTKSRRGRGGTPGRPLPRYDRNPMPIAGPGAGLRRAASAGSVAPPATGGNDVKMPTAASKANDSTLVVDRVPSTPAAKANPLKRPAASIAKTPPAINSKIEMPVNVKAPSTPFARVPSTRQDDQKEAVKAPPVLAPAAAGITAVITALRSSIAPPSTASSSGIAKAPGSSLPVSSLARPRPAPLTSRLSAPSSTASIAQRAGSLPQPSAVSRSALPARSLSTTTSSGIPASAISSGQSLLPRRSLLPTPTKPSGLQAPAARSIAQATSTSALEARRATFGFVRPRPSAISKPTK